MKAIPLTRELVAFVDDEDFELVSGRKWFASPRRNNGVFYAVAATSKQERDAGAGKAVMMHRVVLGAQRGQEVDHINGLGHDNRRANLRICTHAQNNANQHGGRGLSRFKGVYLFGNRLTTPKWRALIRVGGKSVSLGLHADEEAAARAYDAAAIQHFGEFARINFPEGATR